MSSTSDQNGQTVHIQRFNLDDAFDDDDDDEITSFEFTSDSIRNELAASTLPDSDTWKDEGDGHSDHPETNGSISTLDIGGRELDFSRSQSATSFSQSAPEENEREQELELDSRFSTISLSVADDGDYTRAGEPITDDVHVESPESIALDKPGHRPYPSVVIDASESAAPDARVSYLPPETDVDAAASEQPRESLDVPQDSRKSASPSPAPSNISSTADSTQSAPISIASPPKLQPDTNDIPALSIASTSAPSVSLSTPQASASKTHRPTKSTAGPSMLDKVVSKTRPSFLPPKNRAEDNKHLKDWNAMMKMSRAAAEKRRVALQERRLERENRIEQSLFMWQKEIVPDWTVVHRNPNLRQLWWNGIPSKLRASMWEHAVGNPLALSKDTYRTCLARAKRALSRQTFPTTALRLIEEDIETTLPGLHIFHRETGPLYQDLHDILCAWVVARSDEGLAYEKGVAKVAAMVLINLAPQQAFIVMRNLLERHCLRSLYGGVGAKDDVDAYYRIFDTLLADGMPKIYFNFKQHQISPAAYLRDWLMPLFLDHLPFEACARIWDVLVLEGDSFLFRASLAILSILEPRLFFPDRTELLDLLRGENKAALDVARREGQRLDGGRYEIYGVDEETLWDRIQAMEEWWKESTWKRLIQRELPDL